MASALAASRLPLLGFGYGVFASKGSLVFRCHSSQLRASPREDPLLSFEDASYLGKLSLTCLGGAAAVKYGSLILPEITRPNIYQALFMIVFPVLISILALTVASRSPPSNSS